VFYVLARSWLRDNSETRGCGKGRGVVKKAPKNRFLVSTVAHSVLAKMNRTPLSPHMSFASGLRGTLYKRDREYFHGLRSAAEIFSSGGYSAAISTWSTFASRNTSASVTRRSFASILLRVPRLTSHLARLHFAAKSAWLQPFLLRIWRTWSPTTFCTPIALISELEASGSLC